MTERQLLLLPNKDLWRGSQRFDNEDVRDTTEIDSDTTLSPLDKAFAKVLASANGGPLNCLWCGQQFTDANLRAHLDKFHPSVTHPMGDTEVALHQAAVNQAPVSKE